MKLHYSPAPLFARKVIVTAIECGFGGKLSGDNLGQTPGQTPNS